MLIIERLCAHVSISRRMYSCLLLVYIYSPLFTFHHEGSTESNNEIIQYTIVTVQ